MTGAGTARATPSAPGAIVRAVTRATEPKQARSLETRRRLLDAAVDELVDSGYAQLTTAKVAARAGVSRGAQQHHFPTKAALVGEAVRHLAERQLAELHAASERGGGRARTERVLDLVYEHYSGALFTAMLELTLAARGDAELAELIAPVDRDVSGDIQQHAAELFGETAADLPDFDLRLRHALSTIRGLALLQFLGRSRRTTDRQWRFTRAELVRLLSEPGRP